MKLLHDKKCLILLSLLVLLFITLNYHNTNSYSNGIGIEKNQAVSNLLRETQEVSKLIKPGVGPNFLSYQGIISYGYGDCGEYVYLLKERLLQKDIPSRAVEICTIDKRIHSVLEVRVDGHWIIADPTIGIVYKSGLKEILEDPLRADSYWGQPLINRGDYYLGKSFYDNINYLTDYVDDSNVTIPMDLAIYAYSGDEKETDNNNCSLVNGEKLVISWNQEYEPVFLTIEASKPFTINFEGREVQDQSILTPFKTYIFILNNQQKKERKVNLTVQYKGADKIKINTTLLAPRENVEKNAMIHAPVSSYLEFTDGTVDVDKIIIYGNDQVIFSVDVGLFGQEQEPYNMVYSNDIIGVNPPLNGWGPILEEGTKNYRTAQYYENSVYNHSVIILNPEIKILSNLKVSHLEIWYRKKDQNPSFLNIYDPRINSYIRVGELTPNNAWTSAKYSIEPEILTATLGI